MRFVGVDPGLVTGLCSFTILDGEVACVHHLQLDHIGTGQYFAERSNSWRPEASVVAMESFIVTPGSLKKNFQAYSLETIGLVRYFVETAGGKMRMSAPSAHKKLISDDVLKRAGLHFPGEGHATDAARVALHVAIVDHKLLTWALRDEDD